MTVVNWIRGDTLYADDLDEAFGWSVDKRGDTMTGMLTLSQDPTHPLDAATKEYVDNAVIGSVGTGYLPLSGGTLTGVLGLKATANGGVPTIGNPFIGDLNKIWMQGANWGFGRQASTHTNAIDIAPVLTVQRNVNYSGAGVGNMSSLWAVSTIGAACTGFENALIAQLTINASAGVYTAATVAGFKAATGSAAFICQNTNAVDQTGSKSSVAGSLVNTEFDLTASGPDDALARVGQDMVFAENQVSTDGATTFYYGGLRCRGRAVRTPLGIISGATSAINGIGCTTVSAFSHGLIGSFQTAFLSDGATTSYSATSAVQPLTTTTSFSAGSTTLTLNTTNDSNAAYVWPGALVTGTGIAPNTHVLTQSYDGNVTITITIDVATSGTVASGATLTFTNSIGTAFKASGYIGTAAFNSPGFNVDPVGNVTGLSHIVGTGSGPTITSGSGVPASTQPSGSIYLRTSGAAGARLYVTSGGGTWAAVAGV